MDSENPYDLPNFSLLQSFSQAAMKLGKIDDGSASSSVRSASLDQYDSLKAALLARLENKTPPFEIGCRVLAKEQGYVRACSDVEVLLFGRPQLTKGAIYTVRTCRYIHADEWWVALQELKAYEGGGYFFYEAKHLELVP